MDIHIDRLRLVAAGIAEPDAERLGILVAQGLAAASGSLAAAGSVKANVEAGQGAAADELSRKIVAEILRQLSRTT